MPTRFLHPPFSSFMKTRRFSAFTLVELLVATCISAVLGLILYGVASEALVNFARNISINRSYSNARQSLDRIAIAMQSAGHVPILVDATGTDIVSASVGSLAAGIRFWRYSSSPQYYINTPALTDTVLTLSLVKPATTNVAIPAPAVGDMITIPVLGFQAPVTGVSASGSTAVLTFASNVAANTSPTLTAAALATAATAAAAATTVNNKMTCLDWTSCAFIAVNNQLRYFPKFIPSDMTGSTNVNTPANYQILTYLTATKGATATPLPFSFGPTPSINVDLNAEAPDYNNRTTIAGTNNTSNGLNTANTYTYLQSAFSPRNGAVFHGTY